MPFGFGKSNFGVIDEILEMHGNYGGAHVHIMVIGNKCDLDDGKESIRRIEKKQGRELGEKLKEIYGKDVYWGGEISAKTGERVEECIRGAIQRYFEESGRCPICDARIML